MLNRSRSIQGQILKSTTRVLKATRGQLVCRELRPVSLDEGVLVIEWTAYDVVSLQHITLAWISLDGRSYGPEYDQSACRAMP